MPPLMEGYRAQQVTSTYGGVAQRWGFLDSEPRRSQAQRTVDKPWRQQSDKESQAFKKLCSTAFAGEADAQQALTAFAQSLRVTALPQGTIRPLVRYGPRGRPGPGPQPGPVVYQIAGALASSRATREAQIPQHSCCIRATNELDDTQVPPGELLDGYKGQAHAERGCRFLKAPQFLASSLSLNKPERIMALLRVMTVCLLGYAALEYRIRTALTAHGATFPDQPGKRTQNPTARGVFHYFVGMHLLFISAQWPIVINLPAEHQHLLQLLGDRYAWFYR
jgi:transposase